MIAVNILRRNCDEHRPDEETHVSITHGLGEAISRLADALAVVGLREKGEKLLRMHANALESASQALEVRISGIRSSLKNDDEPGNV